MATSRWTTRPGRREAVLTTAPGAGLLTYRSTAGRWVVFAAVLGSALAAVDATIVTIALPAIGRDLGAPFAALQWTVRPQLDLKGRTVLLLDDILDEGVTLAAIADYCRQQGAAEVFMAVLVEKLHLRKVSPGMRADFTGIEVGDRFLFGYGLDYKGYWRNAPGIYAVKGL